jgi:hypothetical protein
VDYSHRRNKCQKTPFRIPVSGASTYHNTGAQANVNQNRKVGREQFFRDVSEKVQIYAAKNSLLSSGAQLINLPELQALDKRVQRIKLIAKALRDLISHGIESAGRGEQIKPFPLPVGTSAYFLQEINRVWVDCGYGVTPPLQQDPFPDLPKSLFANNRSK